MKDWRRGGASGSRYHNLTHGHWLLKPRNVWITLGITISIFAIRLIPSKFP